MDRLTNSEKIELHKQRKWRNGWINEKKTYKMHKSIAYEPIKKKLQRKRGDQFTVARRRVS